MTYNYKYIEGLLLRLIGMLAGVCTDSEVNEVRYFVDAGEYGVALETLVDIVNEEDKQISSESLNLICELAREMQFDKSVFEDRLRGHVSDG